MQDRDSDLSTQIFQSSKEDAVKHFVRALVVCVAGFVLTGCPVWADPSESTVSAAVLKGETFTVWLAANDTTGYVWSSETPGGIRVVNRNYIILGTALGAPGWQVYKLRASAEGTKTLRFSYQRPWEKHNPPARTLDVTLEVGHQTSVEERSLAIYYVHPGASFSVSLPSNPSTGYTWSTDSKTFDNAVLTLVSSKYVPPASRLMGAPGMMEYDFRAVGFGTTTVQSYYARSGAQAVKVHSLVVCVTAGP